MLSEFRCSDQMVSTLYSGISGLDASATFVADITVLRSLARDFTLTFPRATEMYKWVQGQIQEFLKGGCTP